MLPGRSDSRVRASLVRALLICASLVARAAVAQTIRPLLSEYRNRASGQFQLVNDTFLPVNVVLEAKSFTVSETGEISYRPLDPQIHLKLSQNSFRILPRQSLLVAYNATADSLPAYFVIYAAMSGMPVRTSSGLRVQVLLPHTVYILPKKDAAKGELKVVEALFDSANKKVQLEMASESDYFGRVLRTGLVAHRKHVDAPGFPMYPHGNRKLEVDWKENEEPEKVVFHFERFKIQAPITVR